MIYTGDGLKVRICAYPTHYHHWMAFTCYSSLKRFLPDATIELAVFGRAGLFFEWASRLRLKVLRRQAINAAPILEAEPGLLVVTSECVAVRQWDDPLLTTASMVNRSGTACLRHVGEFEITESLCMSPKSDGYAPLTDVSAGIGAFVPENWIHKSDCFLADINRFRTGNETQTEVAVFDEWRRAINFAGCLGLNQT